MNTLFRLTQLFIIIIFSGQAWGSSTTGLTFNYDVLGYSHIHQNGESQSKKFNYGERLNFHNQWGNYQLNSTDTTSLTGSFFALLGDFIVAKGGKIFNVRGVGNLDLTTKGN